jgi:hypothetical protein
MNVKDFSKKVVPGGGGGIRTAAQHLRGYWRSANTTLAPTASHSLTRIGRSGTMKNDPALIIA